MCAGGRRGDATVGTGGPVEVGVDALYDRDSGKFSVAGYTEFHVYHPQR